MELINTTCAAAILDITTVDGFERQKAARVVGKLTFDVGLDGSLSVVSDDPLPVLRADVETPTGILPRDTDLPDFQGVEIIVNGAAYAPAGRPTTQMEVSLAIGSVVHRAVVTGERTWIGEGPDARPSEPVPFLRMPLTYDRAFGGTAEVWLDEATAVPAPYPANPRGRGLDTGPIARALAAQLGSPDGFPRWERARPLPNLEDPRERITSWTDSPRPYCWSTRPMDAVGWVRIPADATVRSGEVPQWLAEIEHARYLRCHPEVMAGVQLAGEPCVLSGMTQESVLGFYFPRVGITLDYDVDGRRGTRALLLRRVVLLPEERRFTAVYDTKFRFEALPEGARSLRVRLVD